MHADCFVAHTRPASLTRARQVGPKLAAAVLAGCGAREQVFCAEVKPSAGPHMLFGIGRVAAIDQQAAAFYEVAVALAGSTPGNGVGSTPWDGPIGDSLAGSTLAYSLRFPSLASAAQFTYYQEDGNGPSAVDLAPESGQPMGSIELKEMVALD